jgi:hypothetical protein
MFSDKRVRLSNFFIRLKSWEYWPFGILQLPVIIYFCWLSIRARSFVFFSASNPGILMGGMFGESKYDVLRTIPLQYVPTTVLANSDNSSGNILALMEEHGLSFPVICKPDLGERGFMVKRIDGLQALEQYRLSMKHSFLVQELVDLPLEFGVFYRRLPHEKEGRVTSVVMKEMLTVTGDGISTLQKLVFCKERARLQWLTLKNRYASRWNTIIPEGEIVELVSIGNHCLGTKFLDGGYLINARLSQTFDTISQSIDGFYFGRFDLRCASVDDLYQGKVRILELNGCGAEPAHIYHPGFSFFKAISILVDHWRNIFLISRENAKRGVRYVPLREAVIHYKKFKLATASS